MKSLTMWIYLSVFLLLLDRSASGAGPDADGGAAGPPALQQAAEWVDCVQASDMCNQNSHCSSRYRVMRQCLVGKEKESMLDTNRECQAALEVLLVSPLYDCRCKRGMKKELQCLQSYWSIHMGLTEGGEFYETSPYEPVAPVRHPDAFRLASIISGMHTVAPKGFQCPETDATCNPCLDATKACNLNATCKKQRTAYITTCHKGDKGDTCNRKRCHKALRQFLDRVPAEFTHRLLFCPCQSEGCSERRRQTIVPDCSFNDKVKPNCLELRMVCRQDPLCRSRLADFHMNCLVTQHTVSSCPNEDNYQACLASYTRLIGTDMTPNYVDSSYSNWTVSPWCTCKGSGNREEECLNFLQDFTQNTCLRNAIQAFGYSGGDSAQYKDESASEPAATVKARLDGGPTTTSEPPNIHGDSEAGEGELHGESMVEPSSGYDVLRRPEGQPGQEDGSAGLHRATAWALLPGLALALLLAQQRAL